MMALYWHDEQCIKLFFTYFDSRQHATSFPLLFIDSYLFIVAVHIQTRAYYKILREPIMCSAIGKYLRYFPGAVIYVIV